MSENIQPDENTATETVVAGKKVWIAPSATTSPAHLAQNNPGSGPDLVSCNS